MYSVLALLFIVPLIFGQNCPLNTANPGSAPQATTLKICTEYSAPALSCCSAAQDEELFNNTQSKIVPLFGRDGCYNNIRKLLCSWVCSPNQQQLTDIVGDTIKNVTMFVSPDWANLFYDSCKGRCLQLGGEIVIEALWGTPNILLNQFESSNDQSYRVDETHPRLVFTIGNSLAGDSLDEAELPVSPASGDDTTGCDNTKNGAAGVIFSIVLISFALFA